MVTARDQDTRIMPLPHAALCNRGISTCPCPAINSKVGGGFYAARSRTLTVQRREDDNIDHAPLGSGRPSNDLGMLLIIVLML